MGRLAVYVIVGGGIGAIIAYILLVGAIIIWPIFNILAYLKVLILPKPIRKKYGTDLSALNEDSFNEEAAETDKNDIKEHKQNIKSLEDNLKTYVKGHQQNLKSLEDKLMTAIKAVEDDIAALRNRSFDIKATIESFGELTKRKDGHYSEKSSNGKKANELVAEDKTIQGAIYSKRGQIEELEATNKQDLEEEQSRITEIELNNKNQIEKEQNLIKDIKNKPWSAWHEWSSRYARYIANKNAIIFMFVGFPILFIVLGSGSFISGFEGYLYISYIQPITTLLGIDNFATGFSSNFISYEYASTIEQTFKGQLSTVYWLSGLLSMPLLTGALAYFSYRSLISKTKSIEPVKH